MKAVDTLIKSRCVCTRFAQEIFSLNIHMSSHGKCATRFISKRSRIQRFSFSTQTDFKKKVSLLDVHWIWSYTPSRRCFKRVVRSTWAGNLIYCVWSPEKTVGLCNLKRESFHLLCYCNLLKGLAKKNVLRLAAFFFKGILSWQSNGILLTFRFTLLLIITFSFW